MIKYFRIFKKFVGNRIYVLFALTAVASVAEGISVALFLPVLQGEAADNKISRFIKAWFGILHVGYSIPAVLVMIICFFTLSAAFLYLYNIYLGRMVARLTMDIKKRILAKIYGARYLSILRRDIGYYNNAVTVEFPKIGLALKWYSTLLVLIMLSMVYVLLSFAVNFSITLVLIAAAIPVALIMKRINLITRQYSYENTSYFAKLQGLLIQALSRIKYLKSTYSQQNVLKKLDTDIERLGYLNFRFHRLQAITEYLCQPLIAVFIAGLIFYYLYVLEREIAEALFLALLILQAVRQVLSTQINYRKFLGAVGSINVLEVLEDELSREAEDMHLERPAADFKDEISFKEVGFDYGDMFRLERINIRIPFNKMVAVVGRSGSGKTTLVNMITGLLHPSSGAIYCDGINLKDINLKAWRRSISYVTQEDVVFNDTIMNNITLWEEKIDKDKLRQVLEVTQLDSFVKGLSKGMDTLLGDNGLSISGGQRQRITLARELYRDFKILILDEATSALDSHAESGIFDRMSDFKGKKTIIVIAHRLSTIKNADYIYVLNNGRVAEEGSFSELMSRASEFEAMVMQQKLI